MKTADMLFNGIDSYGRKLIGTLNYTFGVWRMLYLSLRATLMDPSQGFRTVLGVVSQQIYFTGWQAMPLISILALAIGGIAIIQSSTQLAFLGGTEAIGQILVMIVVRELAPLLVALIVIARSGTAVASEIGNMRVHREIEALEAMGIHPLSYIVFPRLLGGIVSVVCLSFYFNIIALIGGFLVSRLLHELPFSFYIGSLAQAIGQEDVWIFLCKNIFSGAIIFSVACFQGLQVERSSHEVPQATTKAVVNSIVYVVIFNLAVTGLVYLNSLIQLGVL